MQPGDSIQKAVNNSSSGDIITVKPGTYTENVNVNKNNITIRSESGNPDDTTIMVKRSGVDVFLLQGSNIKVTGFKIMGARSGYAGIRLSSCSNCIIENNKLMNNCYGIYFLRSTGNKFSKNMAISNTDFGIVLGTAMDNILSGNTAFGNGRGTHIGNSDGNTFSGNTIEDNSVYGFYICGKSDANQIYNNYFNDTNMTIKNGIGNVYNTKKTAGTNIVGGPYIGGNFWGKPDGTGFSNTATDVNRDGISDSAYKSITGSIYSDDLPLVVYKPGSIGPVAAFSASPTSGTAPLNVRFNDTSTGTPTKWKWTFGDGTSSTLQNPTHKYSKAGNYAVVLIVTNSAGSNTLTKPDYIKVVTKPVANFSAKPTSGKAPLTVTFTDTSTGAPTKWKWSFGDGTSSTLQNPTHKYSTAGSYTVVLTVSGATGSSTVTKTEYIKVIVKPVANFSAKPTSGKAPLTVTFTDTSTGAPTKWKWSFGDGTSSTLQNPTHKYSTAGSYTVVLTVSGATGSSTVTKTEYIKVIVKPVAAFSASPTSGKVPLNVKFTDTSTGAPVKWKWSFGDGTSSTLQNPTHKYSAAGKYTVTLTVTNSAGSNTATKSSYITVTGA